MKAKELLIENKLGIHARAAAQIVKAASAYSSKITLIKNGLKVDGKSIMGIMMLAAAKGSTIMIHARGNDEDEAIKVIEKIFKDKFGEKE
jgi:phosphocarrier protein